MTAMNPPSTSADDIPEGREPVVLRTVDQAITFAPYLLGFHPEESLVVIVADPGSAMQGFVARVDLVHVAGDEGMALFIAQFAHLVGRAKVILLAFCGDRQVGLTTLSRAVERMGSMDVGDAAWTDRTVWRSIHCSDDGCAGDHTFHADGAIEAEAVYRGMVVLPSRTVLVERLSGPGARCRPGMQPHITAARRRVRRRDDAALVQRCRALVTRVGADDEEVDAQLAELAVAANQSGVATALWTGLERSQARVWLAAWSRVVSVAPDRLAAGPLALCGLAGWLSGDGAVASICAERLVGVDSPLAVARALDVVVEAVLPPQAWDLIDRDPAGIASRTRGPGAAQ